MLREPQHQILTILQYHLHPARPTVVQHEERHWQDKVKEVEGKPFLRDPLENESDDQYAEGSQISFTS